MMHIAQGKLQAYNSSNNNNHNNNNNNNTCQLSHRNMTRQMTMWYGREQALFKQLPKDHPRVEMTKVPAG